MINILFLIIFRFYNLYPLNYLEFYPSECTKREVSTVDFQIKGSGQDVVLFLRKGGGGPRYTK